MVIITVSTYVKIQQATSKICALILKAIFKKDRKRKLLSFSCRFFLKIIETTEFYS